MKKIFKKSLLALLLLPTMVFAKDIPITFFENAKSTVVPTEKITQLIREKVKLSSLEWRQAKVQIVYDATNKPDYLLVYLIAAKNYSFTITKIKINENYQAISVTPSYHVLKQDLEQQPGYQHLHQDSLSCPDTNVQFVAATPADEIPTAKAAVLSTAIKASLYGYASHTLFGRKATIENYLNWLSCPKIKGFYNVGHGSPDGILLDDGMLTADVISEKLKNKLNRQTVVLFNSCEVFQEPLKPSVIDDAQAQQYAGGFTTLWIGPSELASRCFWESAFKQFPLDFSMQFCNKVFDRSDTFGIGGLGKNNLNYPERLTTLQTKVA